MFASSFVHLWGWGCYSRKETCNSCAHVLHTRLHTHDEEFAFTPLHKIGLTSLKHYIYCQRPKRRRQRHLLQFRRLRVFSFSRHFPNVIMDFVLRFDPTCLQNRKELLSNLSIHHWNSVVAGWSQQRNLCDVNESTGCHTFTNGSGGLVARKGPICLVQKSHRLTVCFFPLVHEIPSGSSAGSDYSPLDWRQSRTKMNPISLPCRNPRIRAIGTCIIFTCY